ncbi:hypothetical protein F2Q70_00017392 [Brassica cretica]|uniref:Uncharacterized protein n=1 Tax=Brassica cretica TaxID=69181 RepID=A0A8S9I3C9_BRACR|nr:hypothetical protein F2Q70_00017392 [Brassica cretica]
MSSRRKSSTNSHHGRSVPDGSSSQHFDVVPKVEFSAGSIDPEEVNAYWAARGVVKPPIPGLWVPSPFKANPVAGCPSRSCPNGLAAIRHFCRVPELVEFRLPEAGEVALSPPEGYFTCYEAYLMQCHLRFPIPELIIQLLNHLNLSIGQVNPCGLQHVVGILVQGYELGVTLDDDYLEALVEARWSSSPIVHVFFTVSNTLYRVPEGLLNVRELFRGRPCFWADFTLKRVRRSVALHRSLFQPDLPIEEGSESNMDGFIPYVPRTKRDRLKPRTDKHPMVDEDMVDGQLSPDNILKDYLDSQAGGSSSEQFNLEGLLEFDFPPTEGGSSEVPEFIKAARMVNGRLHMINRALDTSKQEAHMARFNAEVADKEIARLNDELESSRRRERESFEKEGRYKALADYRKCRGTVGGLYLTELPDYSFTGEYAMQTRGMAEKDRDFAISEVEENIW